MYKRFGLGVLAFVFMIFLIPLEKSYANVNNFNFSSFDAIYRLSKDDDNRSVLNVSEYLIAVFPDFDQNKGIERAIPLTYNGHPVSVEIISIKRNGNTEPIYEQRKENNNLVIATGTDEYIKGLQTFEINYTLKDVIKDFGDYQELYWDTNGTQWKQSFGRVTARVILDESVKYAFLGESRCFQGNYGATDECWITKISSNEVAFDSDRRLESGENLSFVMKFEKNAFSGYVMSSNEKSILTASIVFVTSSILVFFWSLYIIFTRGRNSKGKGTIVTQFTPPDDGLLNSVAVLKNTNKLIPAIILSLAVDNKIRIVEAEKKGILGIPKKEYSIELINSAGLSSYENEIIEIFFDNKTNGSTFVFDNNARIKSIQFSDFISKIPKDALRAEYFRSISNIKVPIIISGLLAGIMSLLTIIFVSEIFNLGKFILILGTIVSSILFIISIIMLTNKKLTDKGKDLVDYLEGLKRYIKMAEEDRIKTLQSPDGAEKIDINDTEKVIKLYERLIPYAMIFGLEKDWIKQLAVYYDNNNMSPYWYSSNNAFNATLFASSMNSMTSSVNNYSSPTSSSSSGFGGGGFSGGGGGGGGGGGR